MRGRDFLDTADRLARLNAESDWRSAMSRAYYAVYLEVRDTLRRWGFMIPQRTSHRDVYQHLSFPTNADLSRIAKAFSNLSSLRNRADYDLTAHWTFATSAPAIDSVREARDAVTFLDAIDSDPTRRAQAIADIRAVFP